MSKYLNSIIVCVVLFAIAAMATPAWNWNINQTAEQITQMIADWDANPTHSSNHAQMLAAGECMRVYVVNKASIHSLSEFIDVCKAQANVQYCPDATMASKGATIVSRNSRIFLVDLFNHYLQVGKLGEALRLPLEDPQFSAINLDAYLEDGLKYAPITFLKRIENGICTLPEADIVAALKAANRFWSAQLIDDSTKAAAEPIVARIRTLLSTY